jgi:hypothetical protein
MPNQSGEPVPNASRREESSVSLDVRPTLDTSGPDDFDELAAELASELVGDSDDPAEVAEAVRLAAGSLERRVQSYVAIGRIATEKDSLQARLARATDSGSGPSTT